MSKILNGLFGCALLFFLISCGSHGNKAIPSGFSFGTEQDEGIYSLSADEEKLITTSMKRHEVNRVLLITTVEGNCEIEGERVACRIGMQKNRDRYPLIQFFRLKRWVTFRIGHDKAADLIDRVWRKVRKGR